MTNMEMHEQITQECELCGGHHDVFDITGCFSNSTERVLKENPHHFDAMVKRN